jgi:hypothetical protein
MSEKELIRQTEKMLDGAFALKKMLAIHKNFFKFDTHFADDEPLLTGGKTIEYRVSIKMEQVVFNADKSEVKHVVPPRLKDHIN